MQNCKYNLIKNEITEHCEKEFHEQYWYLNCGEWGNAVISQENEQWRASVSNDSEFCASDLNELCEQVVDALLDTLADRQETLKTRIEHNTIELEKAKMRIQTLPACINADFNELENITNLVMKKTDQTKEQILRSITK